MLHVNSMRRGKISANHPPVSSIKICTQISQMHVYIYIYTIEVRFLSFVWSMQPSDGRFPPDDCVKRFVCATWNLQIWDFKSSYFHFFFFLLSIFLHFFSGFSFLNFLSFLFTFPSFFSIFFNTFQFLLLFRNLIIFFFFLSLFFISFQFFFFDIKDRRTLPNKFIYQQSENWPKWILEE